MQRNEPHTLVWQCKTVQAVCEAVLRILHQVKHTVTITLNNSFLGYNQGN